jgi:hypothetical protein
MWSHHILVYSPLIKSATYIEWKIIFKELRMLTELHAWWLIGDRKNKVHGSLSHNVIEAMGASGGPNGTI